MSVIKRLPGQQPAPPTTGAEARPVPASQPPAAGQPDVAVRSSNGDVGRTGSAKLPPRPEKPDRPAAAAALQPQGAPASRLEDLQAAHAAAQLQARSQLTEPSAEPLQLSPGAQAWAALLSSPHDGWMDPASVENLNAQHPINDALLSQLAKAAEHGVARTPQLALGLVALYGSIPAEPDVHRLAALGNQLQAHHPELAVAFAMQSLRTVVQRDVHQRPLPPAHVYTVFDEVAGALGRHEGPLPEGSVEGLGILFSRLQPVDYERALPQYLDLLERHAAAEPGEARARAAMALDIALDRDPVLRARLAAEPNGVRVGA